MAETFVDRTPYLRERLTLFRIATMYKTKAAPQGAAFVVVHA